MERSAELIVWACAHDLCAGNMGSPFTRAPGSGEERVERMARDPREREKVVRRRKMPEESMQVVTCLTAI